MSSNPLPQELGSKRRLPGLVIPALAITLAIAWYAYFNYSDRRENTIYASRFSSKEFATISVNDSTATVMQKLGQPLFVMFYPENAVRRILDEQTAEWLNASALLYYSTSKDGTDRYLIRQVLVRNGRVRSVCSEDFEL
jgi:hypothetical protein